MLVCQVAQLVVEAAVRCLVITMLGATPNPCPTVALAPVPVYVTTLNPDVVFTHTVEVMEPLVLLDEIGRAHV